MNAAVTYLKKFKTRPLQQGYLLLLFLLLATSLLWVLNSNQMFLLEADLFMLIVSTMSDAYLAVSVFVALSLLLIYGAQKYFGADLVSYLGTHPHLQVPVAALLGVLPGCGGAIIVVTQFVHGRISFAALVAVLISTMGDASFLLLASEPQTAALVLLVSVVAGVLFGYALTWIHPPDYLRPATKDIEIDLCANAKQDCMPGYLVWSWRLLLLPGLVLGVLAAFQVDINALFGSWSHYEPATWLGFTGAVISLMVWINQPPSYSWVSMQTVNSSFRQLLNMVANETSFVTAWVITGFLAFEILVYATGFDLTDLFATLGGTTILLAILVGFIPGCGPQIIMTTLYLQGIVPLSAQLANAISNDGDALFPSLALAPKASLYATLYSAVPALIIGYLAFGMGY